MTSRRKRKSTEERRAKVAEQHKKGWSFNGMAMHHNVPIHIIYSDLKALGIKYDTGRTREVWTEEALAILRKAMAKGRIDKKALSKKLGHTITSIDSRMDRERQREAERKASAIPGADPANPIRVAYCTLGRRLTEKSGSFWLDAAPATLDTVMRVTNRIRAENFLPQILNNPNWRCE